MGERNKAASGGAHCKRLAKNVLDTYTEELIRFVEQSEHTIGAQDLRDFLKRYKSGPIYNQESFYKERAGNCLSQHEQEIFDPNRNHPFKRVLTMRFVDLFAPEGLFVDNGQYVSRRVLPGLFLALEKMVGDQVFVNGHKVCMDLIEILKQTGSPLYWEDLYEDEQVQKTADDLLMALLPHFANPMKRITWMLNLINADLASPEEYDFEGPGNQDWSLDTRGLVFILRRLFKHLKHQLTDKELAVHLASRYGIQETRALLALVNTLDRAEV